MRPRTSFMAVGQATRFAGDLAVDESIDRHDARVVELGGDLCLFVEAPRHTEGRLASQFAREVRLTAITRDSPSSLAMQDLAHRALRRAVPITRRRSIQ